MYVIYALLSGIMFVMTMYIHLYILEFTHKMVLKLTYFKTRYIQYKFVSNLLLIIFYSTIFSMTNYF